MRYGITIAAFAALLAAGTPAPATASPGPGPRPSIDVLVAGRPLQVYPSRGTLYVEALKGKEYEIRIRNPYPVRVAVALAVDGLNTIDARHTNAASARKWVIEPYDTVTISGWQTSLNHARRFEFTSEERSYGAWMGKTNDLGVITAVFFRERPRPPVVPVWRPRDAGSRTPDAGPQQRDESRAGSPAPSAHEAGSAAGAPAAEMKGAARAEAGDALARQAAADEYAATGIGRRIDHGVRQIHLDLEAAPAASIGIRYEYRAQLAKLGVLPDTPARTDPLDRRERARGFEDGFCPEPRRPW